MTRYEDAVDLRRYPINDPAGEEYRDLVRACRDQLRDRGVAQLAGFLTPAAVTEMLALARSLTAQAWVSDQTHTVYFEPADQSAGPDQLGADLRGTSGDEAERAHPAALLRPDRLGSAGRAHAAGRQRRPSTVPVSTVGPAP